MQGNSFNCDFEDCWLVKDNEELYFSFLYLRSILRFVKAGGI